MLYSTVLAVSREIPENIAGIPGQPCTATPM